MLFVDDHPTNRLVLGEQLKALGCPFAGAPDAATALASLRAGIDQGDPFGVAIIDAAMPAVDGETLAGLIRQDAAFRSLQLVLFSSRSSRGELDRLRALGFTAFLAKPLKLVDLRDCLARLTGPAALPLASGPAPATGPSGPRCAPWSWTTTRSTRSSPSGSSRSSA